MYRGFAGSSLRLARNLATALSSLRSKLPSTSPGQSEAINSWRETRFPLASIRNSRTFAGWLSSRKRTPFRDSSPVLRSNSYEENLARPLAITFEGILGTLLGLGRQTEYVRSSIGCQSLGGEG